MSRQRGIDGKKIEGLVDYENAGVFTDEELLGLRLADGITATPVEVSEDLFTALRSRYDERQVVELMSALAWENYRARFDHALGIEAEGYSEGAFCPLPQRAKP